jgi:hypothetical protein
MCSRIDDAGHTSVTSYSRTLELVWDEAKRISPPVDEKMSPVALLDAEDGVTLAVQPTGKPEMRSRAPMISVSPSGCSTTQNVVGSSAVMKRHQGNGYVEW